VRPRLLVISFYVLVLVGTPLLSAGNFVEKSALQQITTNPGVGIEPKRSPDGKWLSFGSANGGPENLWIVPAISTCG